ncbi:MAG TPA: hypothetical protein DEH78_07465 [Solibacterales bacterium]|nr:hypothetical protein [Bryobacterales bacterium]
MLPMRHSLIVRSPDGGIKRIPLDRDFFGVGRARNNELSYPDDSGLSRNHLVFEKAGADWTVRDLGSKNGTLLNSQRLAVTHTLVNGDKVAAGHLVFEFSDGSATVPTHETVVFVPGEEPTSKLTTATVVTTLEGAMSGKITTTAAGVTHNAAAPALAADRQMKALIHAGRELSTHRPLSELFEVILGLATEAVNATRGVLMTVEGGRLLVRAARGEGFRISGAVRDRVLNEAASLLVRDVQMDEAFKDRVSIVEQKVRSIIAVPLQTNDKVIGLIYVDSSNFIREFLPEDLNLLTVMANVAAIRIENARLAEVEAQEKALARELQQAAEIQRQLLPAKAPEVEGLEIAGYNAPCRTVGGDYYYFHRQGAL